MGGKNILFTSGKQEKHVLQIAEAEAPLTHDSMTHNTSVSQQISDTKSHKKTHSHSAEIIWPTICDA